MVQLVYQVFTEGPFAYWNKIKLSSHDSVVFVVVFLFVFIIIIIIIISGIYARFICILE